MTSDKFETILQPLVIRPEQVRTHRLNVQRQAESLSEVHLLVKQEKLLSLLEELSNVNKQALNVLTLGPGILGTDGLRELLEVVMASTKSMPDEKATSRLDDIAAEIRSQRATALADLKAEADALDGALINFSAVLVSDVEHLLAEAEAALVQIDANIAADALPLGKLFAQEEAVNTLMTELGSVSALDKFKPLVASLGQLAEIDPESPLVGSIKAGITGLSNLLELNSEALRYEHLLRHREHLQQQLDELKGFEREVHEKRKTESRKRDELKKLIALDEPRRAYVEEISKLLEALNRFLSLNHTECDAIEVCTQRFIDDAMTLSDYLTGLRRDWRS